MDATDEENLMPPDHSQPGPMPEGPLHIPSPPNEDAYRALQSLRGHSTAANWLPAGLWDELDDLRAEQLRVRSQVLAEQTSLEASLGRFRDEDQQHEHELRQAQRDGRREPVEDLRTPPDQRQAERAQLEERFWAGVIVFGEVADQAIQLVRDREDDWLADLRTWLEPAREGRREAQRLLDEAKAAEWQIHQLGNWVQKTSEDGAFGRQPAPTPSAPPPQFSEELLRSSLEVPWHRNRAWKGEGEEPVVSWQELSEEQAASRPDLAEDGDESEDGVANAVGALPVGDPTGVVLPLDESVSGARS